MTVRVAVVGAGPVLRAGLDSLLRDEEWATLVSGDPREADVVIYDVIAMGEGSSHHLDELLDSGVPILALGRQLRPDLAARAVAHGACATLSTEASPEDIVLALREISAGVPLSVGLDETTPAGLYARYGLTPREITVLSGVARGLSNAEICAELFIGLNTLKSAVRTAYRKIGVTSRSQAVAWCLQHGFDPQMGAPSGEREDSVG